MSDEENRRNERKNLAIMDETSQDIEVARRARYGAGRHGKLLGHWIVVDGVRTSYRGVLSSVEECGGGVAILHITDCRALESLANPTNEVKIGNFEVYSHAILGVGDQPKAWAEYK